MSLFYFSEREGWGFYCLFLEEQTAEQKIANFVS